MAQTSSGYGLAALPTPVLMCIMEFLPPRDLLSLTQSCRLLKGIYNEYPESITASSLRFYVEPSFPKYFPLSYNGTIGRFRSLRRIENHAIYPIEGSLGAYKKGLEYLLWSDGLCALRDILELTLEQQLGIYRETYYFFENSIELPAIKEEVPDLIPFRLGLIAGGSKSEEAKENPEWLLSGYWTDARISLRKMMSRIMYSQPVTKVMHEVIQERLLDTTDLNPDSGEYLTEWMGLQTGFTVYYPDAGVPWLYRDAYNWDRQAGMERIEEQSELRKRLKRSLELTLLEIDKKVFYKDNWVEINRRKALDSVW
ncbi:hypothetical protein ABW19_dt0209749 [Dactylella cylindrospora]|nr:hypothetical protein ABW19_dt0209749 [Dactylella cylindrospora]